MNKTVLIAVAAVVLIGGGAGAAYYLGYFGSAETEKAETPVEAPAALLSLEPFLTNIGAGGGERYARVRVQLAVSPEERVATIEADALLLARLRDVVLTQLSLKSYAELSDPGGKDVFREELRKKLQPLVSDATVEEVLFADFVVQ